MRQVGAVLGSAGIAVLMDARLAAEGLSAGFRPEGALGQLPAGSQTPFADAMAQAMLMPAAVLVLGFLAVQFFERPRHAGFAATQAVPAARLDP
jgi:hypothetical protein